uniref:Uncharacterized protein n=1 Tax=viral metagenome TaxID=1070528 RepID=A0A6C0HVT5_9ZZZZ
MDDSCKILGSIKQNYTPIVPYNKLREGQIYIYNLTSMGVKGGYWIGRLLEKKLIVRRTNTAGGIDYFEFIFQILWHRDARSMVDQSVGTWETGAHIVNYGPASRVDVFRKRNEKGSGFIFYGDCKFYDIKEHDYMDSFTNNLDTKSPQEICEMIKKKKAAMEKIDPFLSETALPFLYRPPEDPVQEGSKIYQKMKENFEKNAEEQKKQTRILTKKREGKINESTSAKNGGNRNKRKQKTQKQKRTNRIGRTVDWLHK